MIAQPVADAFQTKSDIRMTGEIFGGIGKKD